MSKAEHEALISSCREHYRQAWRRWADEWSNERTNLEADDYAVRAVLAEVRRTLEQVTERMMAAAVTEFGDMADELATLRAENARLRKALAMAQKHLLALQPHAAYTMSQKNLRMIDAALKAAEVIDLAALAETKPEQSR